MKYWPGTNIRKSHNNDFNWRERDSQLMNLLREYLRQSRAGMAGGIVSRSKYDL
jgi:hypothetical protein